MGGVASLLRRGGGALCVLAAAVAAPTALQAQLIFNEGNCVGQSTDSYISDGEVYEGYDYGVVPYSGNTNSPLGDPPGNPFPADVDSGTGGDQTTLPNGWDGTTGWARIKNNGGDWFELVVTEDHTDLRGYTVYWENNDDGTGIGVNSDNRGAMKFTDNPTWANLRAGTILTISEDNAVSEIRDIYPEGPPQSNEFDTGYVYDLSTDLSFDPFTADDWHVHVWCDESYTDVGQATEYFEGYSDCKVDNDNWQVAIFDASNTALFYQVETALPRTGLDLATGMVQGIVGEAVSNFGDNVPGGAGGVNNQEMTTLVSDPVSGIDASYYEDVDWSTFGAPNLFNLPDPSDSDGQADDTLGGVQDFAPLRDPVLANTYDWTAGSTADFSTAANWQNAQSAAVPGSSPNGNWTAQLANDAGGAGLAQVAADVAVAFAEVSASSGTMTLEVQGGATLSVGPNTSPYDYNGNGTVDAADYTVWRDAFGTSDSQADGDGNGTVDEADFDLWKAHYGETGGGASGRLLVEDGGTLLVSGTVAAGDVEAFAGGTIGGSGTVVGNLLNSAGLIAPGNSAGTLTVTGDYVQTDGTLAVELAGTAAGEYDVLDVAGDAVLSGAVDITLDAFTPTLGDEFTILTASSVAANLTLTGDHAGFNLVVGSTSLVLQYSGPAGTLAAVPEPASLLLAGLALAGVLAGARRR